MQHHNAEPIIVYNPDHPLAPSLIAELLRLVEAQARKVDNLIYSDSEGRSADELTGLQHGTAGIVYGGE